MAQKRCYYEVLSVERSATEAQISEAYRKLALKFHPDRNPGDEEAVTRFKEAAEAFEVLSNPEKRSRYDRFGHAGLEGPGGGAPHFHDVGDIFDAFGDIFGDIFGGRTSGGRRVHRGADIRCDVTIDLLEAAHGASKILKFQRHQECDQCGGSGAKPGTKPEVCPYCRGQGRVRQSTGFFSMTIACPSCQGRGKVIREPCAACRGGGFVRKPVTRKVTIPAGVDHHTQLRLQGEGEPSPDGGPPGDCYCFIAVTEHPLFERKGKHVICQVPLSYSQAALGATIEVPTLDGREEIEIPAGAQNGDVFKLSGRGMPDPRYRSRGDLLVQIHVEVATKLTAEHEEILRKLAEHENRHVTPQRKSFFKKLTEYFRSG
ncbi:MAG: molecular chaperone DnaJ [Planctomycetes bacterium RBG_13_63_9]|nr:MAG: molecular chaperone DnaJ [Planctomycetes bacterium RBG_13_63_9]